MCINISFTLALISILIYKFTKNFIYYKKVLHYSEVYLNCTDKILNEKDPYLDDEITFLDRNSKEIIKLLQTSGIDNKQIFIQSQSFGIMQKDSFYNSFPCLANKDAMKTTVTKLDQSIGVFQTRYKETFNPIYWIDLVIYLPKNLIKYINVKVNITLLHVFQVLWWFFLPITVLYREKLLNLIFNF